MQAKGLSAGSLLTAIVKGHQTVIGCGPAGLLESEMVEPSVINNHNQALGAWRSDCLQLAGIPLFK